MSSNDETLQITLSKLKGLPAWGLVRTYGSMFFLEVGNPLPRVGGKKIHGEWHFLVEMCGWRVESPDGTLVASEDEPDCIDNIFSSLELGVFTAANTRSPSHDLDLSFSSGIRLRTFSQTGSPGDRWTQWQLYDPNDYVWAVDEKGALVYENAHQ